MSGVEMSPIRFCRYNYRCCLVFDGSSGKDKKQLYSTCDVSSTVFWMGLLDTIALAEMIGRSCWPAHMSITNARILERPIIFTWYILLIFSSIHWAGVGKWIEVTSPFTAVSNGSCWIGDAYLLIWFKTFPNKYYNIIVFKTIEK